MRNCTILISYFSFAENTNCFMRPVELLKCRYVWIDCRGPQHVELDDCVRQQRTPQPHWKRLARSTQHRNKMILKMLNHFLRCIATVVVWWHKLVRHLVVKHCLFEVSGAFFVQNVNHWQRLSLQKLLDDCLVCLQHWPHRAVAHGLCQDDIALIHVTRHHHLLVAFERGVEERSRMFCVQYRRLSRCTFPKPHRLTCYITISGHPVLFSFRG